MKRSINLYILTLCIATLPFSAFASDVLSDYAFAQKCYYTLDKKTNRGWDKCIKQFEEVASQYPKSNEAPKALFSAGRLAQEKYQLTHDQNDLQKGLQTYNEFLRTYPDDPLADDCLYRIGVLRYEAGDKEKATRALKAVIEKYPNSDTATEAQELLDKMGGTTSKVEKSSAVISAMGEDEDGAIGGEPVASAVKTPEALQIRRVAIDPGHGGDDPGAIGPKGTKEADISLQIARKLAFKLKNDLNLQPYLTRTRNKNMTLEERNKIANKNGVDLFISIHTNANESSKASGVQVFYLNNATSQASSRLATRENKSSKKQRPVSDKILSTMLQNANTDDSRELAQYVQKALVADLGKHNKKLKDLKVDAALFYVLVGSKSPSILVETSFITNPREEKALRNSDYQWAVADGIAKGVKKYIDSRSKVRNSL